MSDEAFAMISPNGELMTPRALPRRCTAAAFANDAGGCQDAADALVSPIAKAVLVRPRITTSLNYSVSRSNGITR